MAVTAQNVIKNLMRSLDYTKKKGVSALNEAVAYCSGGMFANMQSLVDGFARDLAAHGGADARAAATSSFLKYDCGIVLGNADTGAIIGADAGGGAVRTAESIVPETGTVRDLVYPSGNTITAGGLTVKLPSKSSMNSMQQAVVARLNTWWLPGALELIEDSFGLSFLEEGTSLRNMTLRFYNGGSGTLAYVEHFNNSSTGAATSLSLNINMRYFNQMDLTDLNGKSAASGMAYLDRVLAHELTHAVMAANINWFASLPSFVKEGLAELVHGVDDTRIEKIKELAQAGKSAYMGNTLFNLSSNGKNINNYAGGYMLFRYLAKQVAEDSAASYATLYGNRGKDTMRATSRPSLMYGLAGNDVMYGGAGSDSLHGGDGSDTLYGGAGNDRLYGEAGNDLLYGGEGTDSLYGGAGNNRLYGDAGNDLLLGGAGNDSLYGGTGNDRLEAGTGSNRLDGGAGNDTLLGGTGSDSLLGGAGDDLLYGTAGNNILYGGVGNDSMEGGKGIDTFLYHDGDGNDTITGFEGGKDILRFYGADYRLERSGVSDMLVRVGSGSILLKNAYGKKAKIIDRNGKSRTVVLDPLAGTSYADFLQGTSLPDTVRAGGGNDTVYGNGGADVLYGDAGNDLLYGGEGADSLAGGAGNDRLYGDAGNDILRGGDGNDSLYGGAGNDRLYGEAGNDLLYGGEGTDSLYGGAGNDRLYGDAGNDILLGDAGNDSLYGGIGNDRLYGEAGNDLLYGGEGTDSLYGGAGNDRLYGDAGNDILLGDAGNDSLYGGTGNDRLEAGTGSNRLDGGAGNDTLLGGTGSDSLLGGAGDDLLYGTAGRNTLYGGVGSDTMKGGGGIDTFLYYGGDGYDIIKGFESGKDILRIYGTDYSLARSGSSDVLVEVGSGGILLEGAYGKTFKIYDRRGKLATVRSSSITSYVDAYMEESDASYVDASTWSLDVSVDSIRVAKVATALNSVVWNASVSGGASLAYGTNVEASLTEAHNSVRL